MITPLGEGLDNAAYEVNKELVLRVGKHPNPRVRAEATIREARVLAVVAEFSPLPVPEPLFAAVGMMCYHTVPGVPLLDLPRTQRRAHGTPIARTLGRFQADIQSIPVDLVADLIETDDDALAGRVADAGQFYAAVAGRLGRRRRTAIENFLRESPPDPPRELVFSHNDLGIEHVLVDSSDYTVTGIIDWTDAALVDPAATGLRRQLVRR